MLYDLGKVIDSIYASLLRGRVPKKKLLFLVGNGIREVSNILNDDQVAVLAKKRHHKPGTRAYREFKWRLFEYARYHTANTLPSRAHCYIHRMLADQACTDVITTNYDLFFDGIWLRCRDLAISTNPLAKSREYLWDGYYSPQTKSRHSRRYWKVHGSLSHGVFRNKKHPTDGHILVALPRCAIGTNEPTIATAYGLPTTCPFLGYEALEFPNTRFPNYHRVDATFQPFIDWTYENDRTLFKREISMATRILTNTENLAAIVLVGFRGYYNSTDLSDPWNEELVPALQALIKRGFDDVFMAVHEKQAAKMEDPTSELMADRFANKRGVSFADAGALMEELTRRYTKHFPYLTVDAEYEKWAKYYYLTLPERPHA